MIGWNFGNATQRNVKDDASLGFADPRCTAAMEVCSIDDTQGGTRFMEE